MTAYYNEIDPKAAAWIRELIRRSLIAPGEVDERSIEDIEPRELRGFTQCHFFAGIGVWSYALRLADWVDDRPVWTGSCPCQPFSQAGKGGGTADERHLWPHWYHLIESAKPREAPIFGEQVASPAGLAWFDLVCADLEAANYSVRGGDICAAGAGAPHIRQRLYWVADHNDVRRIEYPKRNREPLAGREESALGDDAGRRGGYGRVADTDGRDSGAEREQRSGEQRLEPQDGCARELGDAGSAGSGRDTREVLGAESRAERCLRGLVDFTEPASGLGHYDDPRLERWRVSGGGCSRERTAWTPSDFIWCRDGKWRPVEPGTFPLVNGAPARVGRLRGYGNAIVAPLAAEFIKAYDETR